MNLSWFMETPPVQTPEDTIRRSSESGPEDSYSKCVRLRPAGRTISPPQRIGKALYLGSWKQIRSDQWRILGCWWQFIIFNNRCLKTTWGDYLCLHLFQFLSKNCILKPSVVSEILLSSSVLYTWIHRLIFRNELIAPFRSLPQSKSKVDTLTSKITLLSTQDFTSHFPNKITE